MIDTADLQAFLAKIEGGTVAVDLLKIGENNHQQYGSAASGSKSKSIPGKLRFALDMEDCLDRFYGGYYSDWACGGQWNRAYQFCQLLANAFKQAHIDVIAFFDGTLKEHKKTTNEHNDFRQRTNSVLKHIRMISTPPPKIWWLAPSGTRTCIRNALRNLNILVVQTVNDHTMEIIEYYRDHKLDGILGVHPDYIIANTQRYFSSHDLRLSYKGSLETKEYLVSKLLTNLSLTGDHLPFVAALLGGYTLLTESMLKSIYHRVKIDYGADFEPRIKRIAEVVRNSPTNEVDEFIKHLNLTEWADEVKRTVEYYQRRGAFVQQKSFGNNRKKIGGGGADTFKEIETSATDGMPFASETSDNDELARKILKDVNSLMDKLTVNDSGDGEKKEAPAGNTKNGKSTNTKATKTASNLSTYSIPIEVVKTSLNRHQRGIMDPRIYQLLTKKQLILPQILEDEHYRELPSIHLFYRPARQMIYAILFNMYHQKYLLSKKDSSPVTGKNDLPDISISEWIWSPQNQYKKPDTVKATLLPWAVPTIQRLWFGTVYEDKQRRMKAFLTVMRSDSPLMLNRGYVPQHMLTMACVLRYIVTNPERNILSRQELDAFLAVAFSPHLINVDYTQELILPGVHLRGVFLASLFMQGVETASLANDACGIPLPWTMTNPWLFFDGKLFHLKLKMSTIVQSLRELCDDHIEIVLKIERFRKAILEDVEHYLLPGHMDPMYRSAFLPPNNFPHSFGNKNHQIHSMAGISPLANGSTFYNPQPHSYFPSVGNGIRQSNMTRGGGPNVSGRRINNNAPQLARTTNSRHTDYQLKVGGVVVGSWAGGVPNKPIGGGYLRYPRTGVINYKRRGGGGNSTQHLSVRNHRVGVGNNTVVARALSRSMYAGKVHKNRKQRRTKDKKLSLGNDGKLHAENDAEKVSDDANANAVAADNEAETEELSNGQTIPAAEENDDGKAKDSNTIPLSSNINTIENSDDKPSPNVPEEVALPSAAETTTISAIANNNNDSLTPQTTVNNGVKEEKTNGNCVVDVNASALAAGKNVNNKKKNKKGKECDTAA
ncbi:hypothetical protein HA402_013405 [Bradysia odoriphaga]|nr:hypothetical protein HA402_013405 [Bradysia odoriphaga]